MVNVSVIDLSTVYEEVMIQVAVNQKAVNHEVVNPVVVNQNVGNQEVANQKPVKWEAAELVVVNLWLFNLEAAYQMAGLVFCCCFISKSYVRPGGIAPSQWTRSVRAVRGIPVAAYSTPGVNIRRHVAYRPPIAVSPFLLALSVSYFKRTLWR